MECWLYFLFVKQKTAYDMRISDWSSDVCSSDLTAEAPHILFYGHYDVQPVDLIDLWEDDPFTPAIKDMGNGRKVITGRGTSDDKGQLITFVEACRAYTAANGSLPTRSTILFARPAKSSVRSLKPFHNHTSPSHRATHSDKYH